MPQLAIQPWMIAARRVMDALEAARPGSARYVGGCVRNALLGEPVSDIDIATQLVPDEVTKVMLAAGIAVHPTGIEHGTLTVVADHQPFEVTTLRRDVETDGRRAVVAFTEDWAEDAQRRDFRMNAVYADKDGKLFDPTGGGLHDIAARHIIFVGNPETRIREDYLRILRFFRFLAWYGYESWDPEGLKACERLRSGLATISVERIWMEMRKLLAAPNPWLALSLMEESGVLHELLPESVGIELLDRVIALGSLEDRSGDGRVQRRSHDPLLRFMSMFYKDAAAARTVCNRLKLSNEERDRVVWPMEDETVMSPEMTPHDVRAAAYRVGAQVVIDRAMILLAAHRDPAWADVIALAETWPRPVMPLTGADLIAAGISPGPQMGATLRKAEAAWIASDFTLSRDALLSLA